MEGYRSEDEQLEALKRWWQENGRSIVIGVVLALGLGFGWQTWQRNQQISAENASNLYQQMLQALASEQEVGGELGKQLATQLKDSHRGTVYAQFAALHLARLAVNSGQAALAEQELRWTLGMADTDSDIHRVAQQRLARVVAAQGRADEALELLADAPAAFAASYAMARGDILLQEGREAEALASYEAAAGALAEGTPVPPTLTDKLEYLGARVQAAAGEDG